VGKQLMDTMVGKTFTIKNDLKVRKYCYPITMSIVESMLEYRGRKATITKAYYIRSWNLEIFKINIDNEHWSWTLDMFEGTQVSLDKFYEDVWRCD
jgi:hypothetical protein